MPRLEQSSQHSRIVEAGIFESAEIGDVFPRERLEFFCGECLRTLVPGAQHCIGDHGGRLYGGMQFQITAPVWIKRIDASVIPDIGPVTAMPAQLEEPGRLTSESFAGLFQQNVRVFWTLAAGVPQELRCRVTQRADQHVQE